jgi:hypothetical protein
MASWFGLLEHLKNIPGRTLLYSLWDLLSYPSMKLRLEVSLLAFALPSLDYLYQEGSIKSHSGPSLEVSFWPLPSPVWPFIMVYHQ